MKTFNSSLSNLKQIVLLFLIVFSINSNAQTLNPVSPSTTKMYLTDS